MGKLKCNTGLAPLKNIEMVETTIMLLHQRGLWPISQINMTTTNLFINTSARKIHESTTVNITLIWEICPPHEPKSQQKLTGTLGKPNPLTFLQLKNSLPKSCQTQKVNLCASPEQKSANLWCKATSTVLQSYLLQQKKERQKVRQIWQSLCSHAPKNLSMILLRAPGKCKMQRLPLKERKHPQCRVLEKVILSSCVDVCDMDQYICSYDMLQKNGITPYVYADAIRDLLIHQHDKFIQKCHDNWSCTLW